MSAAPCPYCERPIADLATAPRDSFGPYCEACEMEELVNYALSEATSDDEGRVTAQTLIRHLAKEGFQIVRIA